MDNTDELLGKLTSWALEDEGRAITFKTNSNGCIARLRLSSTETCDCIGKNKQDMAHKAIEFLKAKGVTFKA